ncbi:GNAT family N-acetyltransferase [Alkalihalobacillus sp. LMS39]|uniref:GNAT family N-acetyltransferase n=1 Tax=Alkalihalobacillus sp. LMS39 TaxID=2924032 RepID=UPI001FB20519|nr:GNAT family N-acetyltransferase [Alkalihalobacillus sp. LMS39]UOE92504.1 GNAT family N-acetyltransferase [Alkalihalobacillus sp. LMS39]
MKFMPMKKEEAEKISLWQYDEPYTVYSMDGSKETIEELVSGYYYSYVNEDGELIGYCCYGQAAHVPGGYAIGLYYDFEKVDIGIGLHPKLTSCGQGTTFMKEVLAFFQKKFPKKDFRLVVAAWNQRAITVYERVGFKQGVTFFSPLQGEDVKFLVMTKQV